MGLVVGGAVLREGRVLGARRSSPPELAGRWELPGGKVEPGEPPAAALERELAEELGVAVEVTGWLAGESPVREGLVLRVATCRLLGEDEPDPEEHAELRWLAAEELAEVDWLDPDRPFLAELRHLLLVAAAAPRLRAVLFDEDDARAVAVQLRADGYEARLERERLAGEDDDEDHPWAVVTDAPQVAVELLVDEYDGWLDLDG